MSLTQLIVALATCGQQVVYDACIMLLMVYVAIATYTISSMIHAVVHY